MMQAVLPVFSVLNSACSAGLMEGAVRRTVAHASATRHSDTQAALADLPTIRNYIARMSVKSGMAGTLLEDTVAAIGASRADAMLRVLGCKSVSKKPAFALSGALPLLVPSGEPSRESWRRV
jgi:alkylation response protein AidB-like acyl-CoA dehydrogenase